MQGFIDAVLDTTFQRVGAFVGAAQAPNSASASFYDMLDNLLGTVSFADNPAGDTFVGFEALAGIKRVRFSDTSDQGFVLTIDRLHREKIGVIPLPAGLPLLVGGVAILGLLRRTRRSRTA